MTDKIIKIYYVIVTSISIIVIWINVSLIWWTLVKKYLITNKEYITSNKYRLEECGNISITNNLDTNNTIKTKEEINQCKENKEKEIIAERNYNLKINIIENLVFTIAFFIIFIFHYIKFKQFTKNE